MTYLLVLLAAQTWSPQDACRETSQFWMAPLSVNVSSRPTLLPNCLTWSWCPSLYLNCSRSVFISQDHPAPLYPNECAPSLSSGFLLLRHLLCVGSTHTGVYLCTEPEATSSSCFGASGLLAFLKRFLCLKCPLLILRKLDIPSICFHSPFRPWPCCLILVCSFFYVLTCLSLQPISDCSTWSLQLVDGWLESYYIFISMLA